jgi:predicted regulator of Ras-like GTPase activity (Roadblock/LC7/MglB family)
MSDEELMGNLAWLMQVVPECEGVIAADKQGKLIGGKTLIERDLDAIAKKMKTVLDASEFNDVLEKGKPIEIILNWENGYMIVMTDDKKIIGAMLGGEDKLQISVLSRRLRQIFGYP